MLRAAVRGHSKGKYITFFTATDDRTLIILKRHA